MALRFGSVVALSTAFHLKSGSSRRLSDLFGGHMPISAEVEPRDLLALAVVV